MRPAEDDPPGVGFRARRADAASVDFTRHPRLEDFDAAIGGATLEHRMLEPAQLQGRRVRVRCGDIALDYVKYPAAMAVHGRWGRQCTAVGFTVLPGRQWTSGGVEHAGGTMAVWAEDREFQAHFPAGTEWAVIRFDRERLDAGPGACGSPVLPRRMPAGLEKELRAAVRRLVEHASGGGDPGLAEALVADVSHACLDGLAASELLPGVRDVQLRRHAIVRRAEALVMEDPSECIRIPRLSRAVGASERSLEYAFRKTYNRGASNYFRLVRLNGARKALCRADPACATVTQVAMDWGFAHLSAFAGNYRELFGELPSETLRHGKTSGHAPGRARGLDDGSADERVSSAA